MEKCILTSKKYWQPMSVNLPQRGLSKKQQKQRVIWLEIRLQKRLQMLPQTHEDPKSSAQSTDA